MAEESITNNETPAPAKSEVAPQISGSNIEQARALISSGDKAKAKELAGTEFQEILKLGNTNKALEIMREFDLPKENAEKIYKKMMGEGAYLEAAELAIEFKMNNNMVSDAGSQAFNQKLIQRNYEPLPKIMKKYNILADTVQSKITNAFIDDVNNGRFEGALQLKDIFKLSKDAINKAVTPLVRIKIQAKNFDIAKSLYDRFKVPLEDVLQDVLSEFRTAIERSAFKSAKNIRDDFKLTQEHYLPIVKKAFEDQLRDDNVEIAKSIMKVYKLEPGYAAPIAKNKYDEYIRNKMLARALMFGKDFKINPSILADDAWDLFKAKLKARDFANASSIAKTFNIPNKKVDQTVKALMKEFKDKGEKELANEIKREFIYSKEGFFSKLLK